MEQSHRSFVDSVMGQRIGGRYVVERILGAGGMGLVAAARYPELDQEVAIKFMRPEFAAVSVLSARFLREARLAAKVKSPHFVRVFDFGRLDSGVPYMVMELLQGRDLHDELDVRGPLGVAESVDIVLQAALGLAEVHALGIVHRDLKPSNLFLAQAAGTSTVKVLDFGVSKEAAREKSELTSTGNVVGTPQYMAPEQIRESRATDARADVWSLGVILYECVTRKLPFGEHGDAAGEVYGRILHTDPILPRTRRPELPADLEDVILKCLLREAHLRYADVGELAEGLRPFAPPVAAARIDAIHTALSTARPPIVGADSSDRVPAITPNLATAEASPGAKRRTPSDERPTRELLPRVLSPQAANTPPESPRVPTPRAETAMTATHGGSAAPQRRGARAMWLGATAVLFAGVAALVLAMRTPKPEPAISAPAVATPPVPAAVSVPASVSVSVSVPASVSVSASASVSEPVPASASAPVPTSAPAPARPTRRPTPRAPAPATSASTPPPAATNPADLILDRK